MRKWAGKIIVPALIVGLAAVQSFGIDMGRAVSYTRNSSLWADDDSTADSVNIYDEKIVFINADTLKKIVQSFDGEMVADLIAHLDTTLIIQIPEIKPVVTIGEIYVADPATIPKTGKILDTLILNLNAMSDTDIVVKNVPAGSLPKVAIRDTLVVPDSLKETDPFKYKYYVAIKDPTALKEDREYLKFLGDTVELQKLDSLYVKDSTEVADAAFALWYGSLSKKEQKRYDFQQAYPALLAELNAKMAYKDSMKYIKDSIAQSKLRILETYSVPDSMFYKRMFTWEHDRDFNKLRLKTIDTTYNTHYYDQPPLQKDLDAVTLGVAGSAAMLYDFSKREQARDVFFYDAYQAYTYTAENVPMYNTKVPYTELAYWGTILSTSSKEETNIKVLTTQNITPNLNVAVEYLRFGGQGMLQDEATANKVFRATTNYLGKRYVMHAGYIYNKVHREENGGIIDNFWIRDTTLDSTKEIDVFLTSATSDTKQNTIFLDQSYRIPFTFLHNIGRGVRKQKKLDEIYRDSLMTYGDSASIAKYLEAEEARLALKARADSIDRNVTTAFVGHSTEYSVYVRNYSDAIPTGDTYGRQFYDNFYINPTNSTDSLRVMRLENKVFVRIQPWSETGIVSKLDVGIGDRLLNYYDYNSKVYLTGKSNTSQNSLYLYAGVEGQYKKYFTWDATGDYTFLGHELNDFSIKANITFNSYPFRKQRNSPLTFTAHFETSLREPDHYQQHIYTNHFKWDNDFSKISTTKIEGILSVPYWKLEAKFSYELLSNNLYFDNDGIIRQNGTAMSVMSASLMKNFKVWWLHLDHQALFQVSSNDDVVPLPMLTLNFRYYLQFDVVKRVMQMQLGANAWWFTKWYMPGYNPALGVFYNQNEEKYGQCPLIDVFLNIQWKRACIFLKLVNVGNGWPNQRPDYFSAHHYINSPMAFKVGIWWPFYLQPAKNSGLGAAASRDERSGSGRNNSGGAGGGRRMAN